MLIFTGTAWIATANGLINQAKPVPHNMITPVVTSAIQGMPIWAAIDLFASCPLIVMDKQSQLTESIIFLFLTSHYSRAEANESVTKIIHEDLSSL